MCMYKLHEATNNSVHTRKMYLSAELRNRGGGSV